MKKLFFALMALTLLLPACKKDDPNDPVNILQRTQWYKTYDNYTAYWNIGNTYNKRFLYWQTNDGEYKFAQDWLATQYVISKLPDGRVKLSSAHPDFDRFYIFSDITTNSTKIQRVYKEDPSLTGYTQTADGWAQEPYEIYAYPFPMKREWKGIGVVLDRKTYFVFSALENYKWSNAGGEVMAAFRTEIADGKTFPMIRLHACGTADDFNNVDVKGKVVVLDRGENKYWEKLENASNAGAIAVICVNNRSGFATANLDDLPSWDKKIPFFTCLQGLGYRLDGLNEITLKLLTDPNATYQYE